MTCIVGVVQGVRIVIGGDGASVSGWDHLPRADAKVFQKGEFLIGYTSSFRMGQLLQYEFAVPVHPDGLEVFEYMVTRFVPALRECFKSGGFAQEKERQESGGTFLVGYRGRLFHIEGDYQVVEPLNAFSAVGCGAQIALGALYVLDDAEQDPLERVARALQAASNFNAAVRRPFSIRELKR